MLASKLPVHLWPCSFRVQEHRELPQVYIREPRESWSTPDTCHCLQWFKNTSKNSYTFPFTKQSLTPFSLNVCWALCTPLMNRWQKQWCMTKISWLPLCLFLGSLTLREASCHVEDTQAALRVTSMWQETEVSSQQPLKWATLKLDPATPVKPLKTAILADDLTVLSLQTLGQHHPANLIPNSWSSETVQW